MNLARDLRHALYTLRKTPGYTLMCIGVLALGIGANAAIFSVLNAVVLDALPYPDPSRLVFLWGRFPGMPAPLGDRIQVARRNYLEWKRHANSFSAIEAYRGMKLDEAGADRRHQVSVGFASPGLFPLLGAQARIGRLFTSAEENPGADRVALLADAFFEHRFQRDPAAIGRTLTLGGAAYTIIGVLPPRFHVPSTYQGDDQVKADVWVPLSRLWDGLQAEEERALNVPARMKPGVTLAQARAEMKTMAARMRESNRDSNLGWDTAVFPFSVEDSKPQVHRAIYVLMGAVAFLLLIACANLANLTLARAAMRSREIAVRLALGATRARIVSQLVAEALVVSLAGAALGLLLANRAVKLMLALKPEDIQRPELIAVDFPVFAFAALAAVLTTILFGLVPSVGASRADLGAALKAGGWGASAVRVRGRQFLIAVEVALALMLLTGAGLMIRSFREILATGIGFDTTRILTADIEPPRKPDAALLDRARSLPGVTAAAITDTLPLHTITFGNFYIQGRPEPPKDAMPICDQSKVSPGYFQAIGLRLEAGRWITDHDRNVAAVNRAFARKYFPNENPIGQVLLDGNKKIGSEIVAVVSDYRAFGVEGGARPTIFRIAADLQRGTLLVRGSMTPATLRSILPDVEMRPMTYYVDEWLSQRRFNTLLLETFAGLALVLGMIGIYGVLSNLVGSRIREIGIRMAIGAAPADIGRLVLRQSLVPVTIGLVAGLTGSLLLGRFLEALLFQVRPRDPLTLAAAVATILLIAPIAIAVPLRRATKVDCTIALREE